MRRFLAFVAVVEIVVAIAIALFLRNGSCVVAFGAPQSLGGGMARATASPDASASGAPAALPPAGSPSPVPGDTPSAAAYGVPQSGNAQVPSAQVPDPNCVGKTTAGLLNSDSSTTPPSCAPVNVPTQ